MRRLRYTPRPSKPHIVGEWVLAEGLRAGRPDRRSIKQSERVMQCPTCNRELADQTHCEVCDRQDGGSGETADIYEGDAQQRLADDSNAPLAPEAPPQAADSSEDTSSQPTESEPDEVSEQQSRESAPPGSTVDAASSPSIDSEGEQSILGQAFQTMEGVRETELGSDDQTLRDVYKTEIGGGVRSGAFSIGGSSGDTYQTDIRGGIHIDVHAATQSSKAEPVPLYSLTRELPSRAIELHESAQAGVCEKAARLKKDTRLMFITCPHSKFAVDAAYVAVGGLGLPDPAQRRELYYKDVVNQSPELTAPKLLEQLPKEKDERVILLYAQSEPAPSFMDSFFDTENRIISINAELQRRCLFMIVVTAPQDAQRRLAPLRHTGSFAYAEVPFLRPFLRRNFPDDYGRLEETIVEQRGRGKWEKDETRFCRQIIDLYETECLESVVADGGPDDPMLSAESLLKDSGPVEKSVLYTAAFFQEVTTPEFCSVVDALLDGRSVAPPANGGDAHARAQAATTLDRIWEEEKDRIFNEWLRETSAAKDSVRVVTLSNSALREPLQKLFEGRHRFYLMDQFEALQQRGIFFHPSPRLAENTTEIAVSMAGAYPDKFNEAWIVELVGRVSSHFESGSSDGADAMFQSLRSLQPGAALNLALARVAAVLRRMLKSPQLAGTVQSSLEQLVKGGYHEDTLLLVNQLQFAQEFDALYWFKQLLHRADNRTRHLTYYCLYAHIKRMGAGVFEGFRKIEEWLPKVEPQPERLTRVRQQPGNYVINAERGPGSYSQFDHFVLRLLIQYCVETVARFNTKHYGEWPSRYPLLAVKDAAEAEERTSLIARWLLHPGIESTLAKLKMGGTRMTLIGALLAEWTFILLGPGGAPAEKADDAPFSPEGLFDLLVRQFASGTSPSQRLELLKYWDRLSQDLLKYQVRLPAASTLRGQLSWKRGLVGRLIAQVKRAPSAGGALPAARSPR
jgi:hypothetical protein